MQESGKTTSHVIATRNARKDMRVIWTVQMMAWRTKTTGGIVLGTSFGYTAQSAGGPCHASQRTSLRTLGEGISMPADITVSLPT